ncbi:hypothetical protein, partial [Mucilaginibacter terrigena]|uniref:hypothetical protein n=1 Tax=Mucilaginibacter terrigena TaxID=2492395 RepID=UPI00193A5164
QIVKSIIQPGSNVQITQSTDKQVNLAQTCTSWYYCTISTLDGFPTSVQCFYGGLDCYDLPIDTSSPGIPPTSGGGDSGGGGSGGNPPNPCAGQNPSSIKNGKVINSIKINLVNPGDGGFPPPVSPDPCTIPPSPEDPCAKMKKQKQKLPTNFTAKNTEILAKPGNNEYGTDLKLANLTSNTYVNTPITTINSPNSWSPNFTWNSTSGYTIGASHRHPAGNAPSPSDVLALVNNLSNPQLVSAGITAKAFYKANAYRTILTSSTTYIITVNDWEKLQNYQTHADELDDIFIDIAVQYQVDNNVSQNIATEYALAKLFGDAINVFKAPNSSINFAVAGIDQDGKLILISCPN